jgi:DNA-binding NtrC family response regulator
VRALLLAIERDEPSSHRLVSVLEPLACAEAAYLLGDLDRCRSHVERASSGMVALPLLELDCRMELLRTRLSHGQGDLTAARHHLQRSWQARDFLLRFLGRRADAVFLTLPRFAELESLRARLSLSPDPPSTPDRLPRYGDLLGQSASMRELFATIESLRELEVPDLIRGETGTGKELVARALHSRGPRRDGAFFCLHCASLPTELFESELFGYVAGAFTGAEEARLGLLEHLDGGTLLLDEITHLSPRTQGKLLQAIDRRVIRPLGSNKARAIDVRFLATSSVDVAAALEDGTLNRDLYYRLRAVELDVPPLRARAGDPELLFRHFVRLHTSRLGREPPLLSNVSFELLAQHSWPGNVRELESLVLRLIVTGEGDRRGETAIREWLAPAGSPALFSGHLLDSRSLPELRSELERAYLMRLFRRTGGSIRSMTEALGIRRSNLYTWFRKLEIDIRRLREEEP